MTASPLKDGLVERDDDILRERDRMSDALAEASFALGGPEWCGRIPPQEPPQSGDLTLDVPVLCREAATLIEQQAAQIVEDRADYFRWKADWQGISDHQEAQIAEITAEREDWARRFKLNDVTPWEWMTRAQAAEAQIAALQRERDMFAAALDGDTARMAETRAQFLSRAYAAETKLLEWENDLDSDHRQVIENYERTVAALQRERETDEQEIANLMADINRLGHEKDALQRVVEAARRMREGCNRDLLLNDEGERAIREFERYRTQGDGQMIERRVWRREFREKLGFGPTWFRVQQDRGVIPKGHKDPGGQREWFTESEVREAMERLKSGAGSPKAST